MSFGVKNFIDGQRLLKTVMFTQKAQHWAYCQILDVIRSSSVGLGIVRA
jgi:hypothetical protein